MNFLTQQQEVAAILGLDETQTNQSTLIKRWLNISQRDIGDAADWPFLEAPDPVIIQTEVDYTTGTASVTLGGTTVTFSAVVTASKTGHYIKFAGDGAWYRITSHTGGTDTATIAPGAVQAFTASEYTVRKILYTLPSTIDRVRKFRISDWPYEFVSKPSQWLNPWSSTADQTGNPRVAVIRGRTTSDEWQATFWPYPDAIFNIYIENLIKLVDLVSNSDVSIIPEKWHSTTMLQGAIWRGWEFLDDSRAGNAQVTFHRYIQEMKDNILPNLDEERVLQPVDGQVILREPVLPGSYPLG